MKKNHNSNILFLSYIFKKIGEGRKIDPKIPLNRILNLIIIKGFHLMYWIIRLRKFKKAFVSHRSTIKSASNLKFGSIIINRGCYIDAMGENGIECRHNVSFGNNTTMIVTGSISKLGKGIKIENNV